MALSVSLDFPLLQLEMEDGDSIDIGGEAKRKSNQRGAMENGLKDERCQVFLHVIQTIEATRPRIFIIEAF